MHPLENDVTKHNSLSIQTLKQIHLVNSNDTDTKRINKTEKSQSLKYAIHQDTRIILFSPSVLNSPSKSITQLLRCEKSLFRVYTYIHTRSGQSAREDITIPPLPFVPTCNPLMVQVI